MVDLMSLLRDVLVCSLQVWMLNDFGKNMFPYRVEPLWKRIGVYFAAALCIFIANHMGTTLFNIAIIPASYTIAAIIIFKAVSGRKLSWPVVIICWQSYQSFCLLRLLKPMLFTYPVAGAPDKVIALLVGMVLFVVNEANRVENQVIMQMVFIDVSCQNKLILAA